jgi:hypothetical protein
MSKHRADAISSRRRFSTWEARGTPSPPAEAAVLHVRVDEQAVASPLD